MAQLARRTADGAAITALTEAATHADYYLTREHAVVLLGQFPTAVALPTLLTALHDTSSQVRTAAATSIGHAGGEGALAALTTAFGSDTSYDVRAAAVGAIARMDRDHMHDILTRALAMPSYQEGIQNAALTAAAQLGDTAVTSQVDSMIALNALPAEVLAVFGMRGNSRAMDLLMHHVNDERAGVRRWVVDAIRDVIGSQNKPLAIQQLQAAANIATHADTKAAIAGALVALGRP
jgi:HEAT repeat protein